MLISRRVLKNVFGKTVNPGDPIPFPEKWNRLALQSHINIGWIEEVPEKETAPVSKETRAETKASPTDRTEDAGAFSCHKCKREFKTQRAVKIHVSRAH